jgi:hypothetical protein
MTAFPFAVCVLVAPSFRSFPADTAILLCLCACRSLDSVLCRARMLAWVMGVIYRPLRHVETPELFLYM